MWQIIGPLAVRLQESGPGSQVMFDAGFERGTASPVVFWHEGRAMWCVVHDDDFSFVGYDLDLDFIVQVLESEYEIKVRGRLGPGPQDVREMDILGRILNYEECGCSWKADPRHRRMIIEHFGFNESTKSVTTTGVKDVDAEGV